MIALFERHVEAELAGDLDTTMNTMTDDPHLTNVPTGVGGVGRAGVRTFYHDHLVGKFFPPDMTMTPVSRTVGDDQVVDELVISLHPYGAGRLDAARPRADRAARRGRHSPSWSAFKDGKISHEHIYWDQASVLVQLGMLDPAGLPVVGAEGARKVLDPKQA